MHKNRLFVLLLTVVVLALGALSACTKDTPTDKLKGTEWVLIVLSDRLPLEGTTVSLAFKDGQAGGSAGCNSYSGAYHISGNEFVIDEIVSTLIACADEGVMQQEQFYLAQLGKAESFSLEDGMLVLHLSDNSVLTFSK